MINNSELGALRLLLPMIITIMLVVKDINFSSSTSSLRMDLSTITEVVSRD